MKTAIALSAALLATAACAQVPPPQSAAVAPAAPAVEDPAGSAPAVMPMQAPVALICANGDKATIDHDKAAGIMRAVFGGQLLALQEQVGRTPPRYVTGSDTLEFDGQTAHLIRGKEQRLTCQRVPDAPVSGTLWGTLTKLDRMALPPGTRAKVMLVDAARADAPSVEIASTILTTTGNQVPLHFILSYDPAKIGPQARPLLQARFETLGGELMYITDTANMVLENGQPQPPVELKLVRTGQPAR